MSGNRGVISERTKALAARAVAMRAAGSSMKEIAEALGVSRSYASSLYTDPDRQGERARKDSYSLPCPQCGKPMTGSNGPNVAPERCADCAAADPPLVWTPEAILDAFRAFHAATGRTPTVLDVIAAPSMTAKFSEERQAEAKRIAALGIDLPRPTSVYAQYGSWKAAVVAAGLAPSRSGTPSHRGPYRRRKLGPRAQALLGALRDGPLTAKEATALTGSPDQGEVQRRLRNLAQRGLVSVDRSRRPHVYRLTSPAAQEVTSMADNSWVVFRIYEQSLPRGESVRAYQEVGRVAAPTQEIALERLADEAGENWYAVPARFMEPMALAPVEKLAVVARETG